MLADFYIADPDNALRYANRMEEPGRGEEITRLLRPVQTKGITPQELSTLWAILAGQEWDIETHMSDDVQLGDDGESWLYRFPNELAKLLAHLDDEALAGASVEWGNTEELSCDPAVAAPLLNDLRSLARQAADSGKSVYLWGCL